MTSIEFLKIAPLIYFKYAPLRWNLTRQEYQLTTRNRRTSDKTSTRHFDENFPAGSVRFGCDILSAMKKSLHPPHVVENDDVVPNAAFPFCKYDGSDDDGVHVDAYGERFCNAFQVRIPLQIHYFSQHQMILF